MNCHLICDTCGCYNLRKMLNLIENPFVASQLFVAVMATVKLQPSLPREGCIATILINTLLIINVCQTN